MPILVIFSRIYALFGALITGLYCAVVPKKITNVRYIIRFSSVYFCVLLFCAFVSVFTYVFLNLVAFLALSSGHQSKKIGSPGHQCLIKNLNFIRITGSLKSMSVNSILPSSLHVNVPLFLRLYQQLVKYYFKICGVCDGFTNDLKSIISKYEVFVM